MKAWYIESANSMELIDLPFSDEVYDREVLVRNVSYCLCNGSDPGIFNGNAGYSFPMIFGHESGGYIEKIGSCVTEFKVGDRVSWWCTIGTFSEYSKVNIDHAAVVKTPDCLDDKYISILELVIASSRALMPFMNGSELADEHKNKNLLIVGLGPSGLVITQLAKYLGFKNVYGWDLYELRRNLALKFGIAKVADPLSEDFPETISQWEDADIGIDMMDDDKSPNCDTFDNLIKKMKGSGRIVSYGHPEHGRRFSPHLFQGRNLSMSVPENNIARIREYAEIVMELIQAGHVKVEPLATHETDFSQVKDLFYQMLDDPGKFIKIIFTRS